MEIVNTIGEDGCACGDYKSDNLIAEASCRKSGSSGEWSEGVVHLLRYRMLTADGARELMDVVDRMFGYGADGIVLVRLSNK